MAAHLRTGATAPTGRHQSTEGDPATTTTSPPAFPKPHSGCRRFAQRMMASLGVAVAIAPVILPFAPCAAKLLVKVADYGTAPTPFIQFVRLKMGDASLLDYVQFTIAPKPGSVTRAVSVRYPGAYLKERGYLDLTTGTITVPVFCLYADYMNHVELVCGFVDGTTQINNLSIATRKYGGGYDAIYNHPAIVQARTADTTLSYDYILLKTFADPQSPKIIDTDGEVRWVGTAGTASGEVIFYDRSFFEVGADQTSIIRQELDGTFSRVANYAALGVTAFSHNFDYGKTGIITDVNTADYFESEEMEIDTSGKVLHTWNFADIITKAMIAGGDDPTQFVAAAGSLKDWFHNNSAAYRPSDDTLVVSSRENFVLGLDYETGNIKWILGDPTKQWHEFASLRKYALNVTPGTHYPIGQHAVSFYHDDLLLMDNGFFSSDHKPAGVNRTYSAPRKYSIVNASGTAGEIWNYTPSPSIITHIAGSVYEDRPGNYLLDYACAGPDLYAELIGLNNAGDRVFDYRFTEEYTLATAWNAVVLHLENLVFD
jgi:arylsulfate sulfotransferase